MDNLIKVANSINSYIDKSRVNVPILNNLKVVNNDDKNIIFIAIGRGIIEQFLYDGELSSGETIESRIDKNNSNLANCTVKFYKDYKKVFDYKIYIQDIKVDNRFIKQMSAYFVDNNCFYQISLAIGPYEDTDKNELITTNLFNSLKDILDETDYIEDIGGKLYE